MTFNSNIKVWTIVAAVSVLFAGVAEAGGILRTVLNVRNVSCGSCLRVIESEFRKTPGITGMAADIRRGIVVADHENEITSGEVAGVVSRLGYPSNVVSTTLIGKKEARVFRRLAGFGAGPEGCSQGGCSTVANSWKELYRRFVKPEKK